MQDFQHFLRLDTQVEPLLDVVVVEEPVTFLEKVLLVRLERMEQFVEEVVQELALTCDLQGLFFLGRASSLVLPLEPFSVFLDILELPKLYDLEVVQLVSDQFLLELDRLNALLDTIEAHTWVHCEHRRQP